MKNKREVLNELNRYGEWVEEFLLIEDGKVRIGLIRKNGLRRCRRDLEIKVKDDELKEFLNG